MNGRWRSGTEAGLLAGLLLLGSVAAMAQSSQSGQSSPPAQQGDKTKPAATDTLTLDTPAPPVNPEEDAAFKAFDTIQFTDGAKKIAAGEAFIQKYPQSRYLAPIYSNLVKLYLTANDVPKMEDAGEKDVALAPNDVQTLAILGQTIPRAWKASMPNAQAELDKAEKYSKSAIELTPTIPKPDGMTDDKFALAKSQTLSMAHAGLGLVYFRRGKLDQAIPEFEEATKIDPNPEIDPVNYYLLGLADEKTSHFDGAVAAYTKCATVPGSLQATCKNSADESKKLGATQLSAPK